MSTCRWCTPGAFDTTEFLKNYASKRLSPEDLEGSNDDLCYCLECVVEYHKAREELPGLHEVTTALTPVLAEQEALEDCCSPGGWFAQMLWFIGFWKWGMMLFNCLLFYIELQRADCRIGRPFCFVFIQNSEN